MPHGHIRELSNNCDCRLDGHTYRRLHNVTLNTPDGATQIEHVFLSVYGIFVLETKNMSGWIFGREAGAVDAEALQTHLQVLEPAAAELQTPQSPGCHPWRQP